LIKSDRQRVVLVFKVFIGLVNVCINCFLCRCAKKRKEEKEKKEADHALFKITVNGSLEIIEQGDLLTSIAGNDA